MNRNARTIACCLAIALLSGCALTTEQVSLGYSPIARPAAVAGADNVTVSVNVTDQRSDKTRVSSKKNGFGMEMAAITTSEDVAATVRKAIETELRGRGFKLGVDAAQVRIGADVTRFYNDHKMGFFAGDAVADLNLSVMVSSKSGKPLYSKHVVAQGKEENTMLATGNNAKIALERALENGMKMLFEDPAFVAALLAGPGS